MIPKKNMAKLQKQINKKIGDTEDIEYKINLPKKVVEDSKLLDKEIKAIEENGKIIIKRK